MNFVINFVITRIYTECFLFCYLKLYYNCKITKNIILEFAKKAKSRHCRKLCHSTTPLGVLRGPPKAPGAPQKP